MDPAGRSPATTPAPYRGGPDRAKQSYRGSYRGVHQRASHAPLQPSYPGPARGRGRGGRGREYGQWPLRREFLPPPPPINYQPGWLRGPSLALLIQNIPLRTSTWDLYQAFAHYGNIVLVEILDSRITLRQHMAKIRFEPPPKRLPLSRIPFVTGSLRSEVEVSVEPPKPGNWSREALKIFPAALTFGELIGEDQVMDMVALARPRRADDLRINFDFSRRALRVDFPVALGGDGPRQSYANYKFHVRFDELGSPSSRIYRRQLSDQKWVLVISLQHPPQFYRKRMSVEKTHSDTSMLWTESDQWYRTVEVAKDPILSSRTPVSLDNKCLLVIDFGRWTTYWFEMDQPSLRQWTHIEARLMDFNIKTRPHLGLELVPRRDTSLWSMLDAPLPQTTTTSSSLDDFALLHAAADLPFDTRYQLEACLSKGILIEHTITAEFIAELARLCRPGDPDRDRARLMLEYAADRNERIIDPMTLIRDPAARTYFPTTVNIPHYCALMRKATVTPTRIYFHSPTVETTNRVVRRYREHQDYFMRIQFSDELPHGRIKGSDAERDNELFTRAFRVLHNGIRIGRYHFKFLAFGNSQIREHGAFFFCQPENSTTTCEDIRLWMGSFDHILNVAKYAARVGQCFSTTRLIRAVSKPTVRMIPEIERNGYCFTDGVGKISPFLAQMVADDWGIDPVPSAFQFRMGGSKGVLVTWRDAKSTEVCIRPSQQKFRSHFNGLEIIRCSQYSAATLNRQTITILTSLGVGGQVFLDLLDRQLRAYQEAETEAAAAVQLLTRYVDQNQMTLTIARMVLSGFMEANEPFVLTLLKLWQAWSMKLLKEKARVIVDKGAFVLGCADETGTLRGYDAKRPDVLPQIFLRVPDGSDQTRYHLVTGRCIIGRNPSLHPGDIQIVEAVDVPALHHMRDVVVFPTTGDRDVPSMLSGGDLDGDDFFVMWDPALVPAANHPSMDYTTTKGKNEDKVPSVTDLITFFVLYMKNDQLPLIATAHLAWADYKPDGARDPICLELAALHSQAVDYVKSGVTVTMPKKLDARTWPHFMEKNPRRSYHSASVLGQLYDRVSRRDFRPIYTMPFDQRILSRFELTPEVLKAARQIKTKYDMALRRIMGQLEIETEFEIWTTFVLSKPRLGSEYKLQENVGRESAAVKQQYRDMCLVAAGASSQSDETMGPFVAAMYQVTKEEVEIVLHQYSQPLVHHNGRVGQPRIQAKFMPLISFPWLFDHILCRLATESTPQTTTATDTPSQQTLMPAPATDVVDGEKVDARNRDDTGKASAGEHDGASLPQATVDLSVVKKMQEQSEYVREGGCIYHRGEMLHFINDPVDDDDIEDIENGRAFTYDIDVELPHPSLAALEPLRPTSEASQAPANALEPENEPSVNAVALLDVAARSSSSSPEEPPLSYADTNQELVVPNGCSVVRPQPTPVASLGPSLDTQAGYTTPSSAQANDTAPFSAPGASSLAEESGMDEASDEEDTVEVEEVLLEGVPETALERAVRLGGGS